MKLFLVVILISCTALSQDDPAIARAKAACGPDDIKFEVEITDATRPPAVPESGKALVYIIGDDVTRHCDDCGIVARIGIDGAWTGAIKGNSYLSFATSPGEHHLCANWQSQSYGRSRMVVLANFAADAGKVYYFRLRMAEESNRLLDLDLVNSDQGQYLVVSSRVSESHPKKHH